MLALTIAAVCAALMGFAIQRGGTCLVAAMDEVVSKRRGTRLLALAEASLLVACGMIVAQLLGLLSMAPRAYAVTGWTIAGGVIMGLGAFVAGACVFGAIARIGNGEPAFALLPIGFFAGSLLAVALGTTRLPQASASHSLVLGQAFFFAGPLLALALWRVWQTFEAARKRQLLDYVWSPHVATGVIGVTFIILLLLVGPWSYTDYLAETARRMAHNGAARGLLLLALFVGAMLGGWTAGRIKPVRPSLAASARCFAGGTLLGLGGSLVPGTNDGLILLGLPLLYPHALVAFGSMLLTIYVALVLQRRRTVVVQRARLA